MLIKQLNWISAILLFSPPYSALPAPTYSCDTLFSQASPNKRTQRPKELKQRILQGLDLQNLGTLQTDTVVQIHIENVGQSNRSENLAFVVRVGKTESTLIPGYLDEY